MVKRERSASSRYEEIAVDIARKIVDREYREGDRVLGRSHLAGKYKVSPETIRRAIAILHDRGIVRAVPGSGIRVVSRQLASDFLEGLQTRSAIEEVQEELAGLMAQRRELDQRIEEAGARLSALAGRALAAARRVEEVEVPPGSWVVGQTLRSARLRNLTGATVIAVIRGGEEHFSPGAEFVVNAGDLLLLVGPDPARDRLERLVDSPDRPAPAHE